eukprot:6350337-Pyramimonas_sp.AAC.1
MVGNINKEEMWKGGQSHSCRSRGAGPFEGTTPHLHPLESLRFCAPHRRARPVERGKEEDHEI